MWKINFILKEIFTFYDRRHLRQQRHKTFIMGQTNILLTLSI